MNIEIEQKYRAEHSVDLQNRLKRLGEIRRFGRPGRSVFQSSLSRFRRDRRSASACGGSMHEISSPTKAPSTTRPPKLAMNSNSRSSRASDRPATFASCCECSAFGRSAKCIKFAAPRLKWKGHDVEVSLDEVGWARPIRRIGIRHASRESRRCNRATRPAALELGLSEVERRSYLELLLAGV